LFEGSGLAVAKYLKMGAVIFPPPCFLILAPAPALIFDEASNESNKIYGKKHDF